MDMNPYILAAIALFPALSYTGVWMSNMLMVTNPKYVGHPPLKTPFLAGLFWALFFLFFNL